MKPNGALWACGSREAEVSGDSWGLGPRCLGLLGLSVRGCAASGGAKGRPGLPRPTCALRAPRVAGGAGWSLYSGLGAGGGRQRPEGPWEVGRKKRHWGRWRRRQCPERLGTWEGPGGDPLPAW